MNINKSICPICGKPNNCAFEAGLSHKKCWCEEISVSEELMEKVPSDLRGKACICKECIMSYRGKIHYVWFCSSINMA